MSKEMDKNLAIISDISEGDSTKLIAALNVRFKMDFYEWEHFTLRTEEERKGKYGGEYRLICHVEDAKQELITSFYLESFPRNSSILVSTHVSIPQKQQNKFYGTRFHRMRIAAASLAGFKKLLATVCATNEAEVKILTKHDWKVISSYHNEQGERIDLWERSL